MQLKLIPPTPAGSNTDPAIHLPTVLFTLSYPPPPSYLPLPAAYAGLVKVVVEEGLLDGEGRRSLGLTSELLGPDPFAATTNGDIPFNGLAGVNDSEASTGSLTPHSLDKSTWIAAVLSEVVFDLSRASSGEDAGQKGEEIHVRCKYVDGREVEWTWDISQLQQNEDMEGEGCYAALRRVLADVSASAAAGERERRAREGRWHSVENQCAQSVDGSESVHSKEESDEGHGMRKDASASIPGTVEVRRGKDKEGKKHKKQRSLLMSLVAFASLINPKSDKSEKRVVEAPAARAPSPEQGHTVAPQVRPPTPLTTERQDALTSSDLRRRARATLVDVFRRFVLTKLKTAIPPPDLTPAPPTGGPSTYASAACSPDSFMSVRSNVGVYRSVRGSGPAGFSPFESTDDLPMGLAVACGGLGPEDGYEGGYGSANEGGYLAWVVRSLLWRVERELSRVRALSLPPTPEPRTSPTLVDEPVPPFFDEYSDGEFEDIDLRSSSRQGDERDGETTSTTTDTSDDSSVHTPVEGSCYEDTAQVHTPDADELDQSYFPTLSGGSRTPPAKIGRPLLSRQSAHRSSSLPRTPSPAWRLTSPPPSPHALHTALRALSAEKARLLSVLARLASHTASQSADEAHIASVLEIKSRRRAWSNRRFMGRAEVRLVGLATPERRSSLGRFCVCASDLDSESDVESKRELVVTTADSNILRLFPVCEEEEDADIAFVFEGHSREDDDAKMLRDAEDGLLGRTIHSVKGAVSPPRRKRTMSMGPILPAPVTMGSGSGGPSSYPGAFPRLSCVAAYTLHEAFNPQTKVDLFDALGDDDDDEDGRWGTV